MGFSKLEVGAVPLGVGGDSLRSAATKAAIGNIGSVLDAINGA